MPFEFDGDKYKKASAHQKEWANNILGELKFVGNEVILDLGCGDGVITNQLAEMVPNGEVLGIDASEGMIKTAIKGKRHNNVKFELKNINSIEWLNEFKALKSGGTIRFNFAGEGNCFFFLKVIRRAMAKPDYRQYFRNYNWPWYMPSIKEYKELAAGTYFSEIEIWGENADRYFEDSAAMIKWIDQPSIVPFLKCVPEPEKENFRNYVVEQMIAETKQENGTCFETFRRVNIRATKSN